jgi:hypothetical protein
MASAVRSGDVTPPMKPGWPRGETILLVNLESLRRGSVEAGETCEIAGVGPVPVSVARDLFGDSLLKVVIRDGTDIRTVVHAGRTPTAKQRTAILVRDGGRCVRPTCDRPIAEIDHTIDWAAPGTAPSTSSPGSAATTTPSRPATATPTDAPATDGNGNSRRSARTAGLGRIHHFLLVLATTGGTRMSTTIELEPWLEILEAALPVTQNGALVRLGAVDDAGEIELGVLPLDGLHPAELLDGFVAPDEWAAIGLVARGWASPPGDVRPSSHPARRACAPRSSCRGPARWWDAP